MPRRAAQPALHEIAESADAWSTRRDENALTWSRAESLLVPSRLPEAFIGALMGSSKGLGEALADLRLEARRELLWFGSARTPGWAEPVVVEKLLLTRSYRIIVAGRPSILIAENFPLVDSSTA